MSKQVISEAKRRRVFEHFHYRCAYCLTAQRIIGPLLEIDHMIPESRGGSSNEDNLTSACPFCNSRKADKAEAADPQTQVITILFNPRRDKWPEHFEWQEEGVIIQGKTAKGRATVAALDMNHPAIVNARRLWVAAGWHPPTDHEE